MTAETYDNLKQYVGNKDDFTDDLLNMGYTKGKKDGYNQALEDLSKGIKEILEDNAIHNFDCIDTLVKQLTK